MIVIIDNYDSFTYNLYQSVAMVESDVRVFRHDKIDLETLSQLNPDGIILSPGPGRPEDAGICIPLIQRFIADIPILGVCLGHQAIAAALGGHVKQADQIIHGKPTYIFHYRDALFHNLPLPFQAGRYHSLIVERKTLPDVLSVEAENEAGLLMAIKHKNFPCYGIQFHPESILTPQGNQIINNFTQLCHRHHAITHQQRLIAC